MEVWKRPKKAKASEGPGGAKAGPSMEGQSSESVEVIPAGPYQMMLIELSHMNRTYCWVLEGLNELLKISKDIADNTLLIACLLGPPEEDTKKVAEKEEGGSEEEVSDMEEVLDLMLVSILGGSEQPEKSEKAK